MSDDGSVPLPVPFLVPCRQESIVFRDRGPNTVRGNTGRDLKPGAGDLRSCLFVLPISPCPPRLCHGSLSQGTPRSVPLVSPRLRGPVKTPFSIYLCHRPDLLSVWGSFYTGGFFSPDDVPLVICVDQGGSESPRAICRRQGDYRRRTATR